MKLNKREWMALAAGLLFGTAAAFYAYQRYSPGGSSERGDLLDLMPADSSAILFADLGELRSAPFLMELYTWAPPPQADEDYTKFLNETGFDYFLKYRRAALTSRNTGVPIPASRINSVPPTAVAEKPALRLMSGSASFLS